jgi:hypothetical protein
MLLILENVFNQVCPHCWPMMRFLVQAARVSLKPLYVAAVVCLLG